jgi:purine-cytosine permease-like protein
VNFLGFLVAILGFITLLAGVCVVTYFTYKGSHGYSCPWQERAEEWRRETIDLTKRVTKLEAENAELRAFRDAK